MRKSAISQKKLFIVSKNLLPFTQKYSYTEIENVLIHNNFDYKLILDKSFNIFKLRDIIGTKNVLPFMGRVLLDAFGLIDEQIMEINKLDLFLTTLSSQYLTKPLYHTCMHGADVTQSLSLFFINSNAEKVSQSKVLDILGILIAAMGHDLGHPGLTNNFQINASTDLAITYNDISCLENYHASKLFSLLKKDETNIFQKLSIQEYQMIRKRMISEILATDMTNHGKVLTVVKSNIHENKNNLGNIIKEFKLSGNENTKFSEQQSLFNFLIHCADLAHNTKLFEISIQWVELLSEEYWNEGDLEKEMHLPVTFLCDREKIDIPNSQKGFIIGFIIPTFECLTNIFPTLKFFLNNASDNLVEWQKLIDQHRQKGWTPKKKNEQKKIKLTLQQNNNNKEKINKSNNNNKILFKNCLNTSPSKKNQECSLADKLISPLKEKMNPFVNENNDNGNNKNGNVGDQLFNIKGMVNKMNKLYK